MTKIALHRTRLRFSDHKSFSVLILFRQTGQAARWLVTREGAPTEKIERNFSFFSSEQQRIHTT
ncbi:hypothetical protein B5M10_08220 [Pluralibacter gergoviae]|nr:hypothetical protein B5M10_08220 [Pluralibacter gergoviae]